ncbi:MAG TPA: CBS domain-containing protein [Gammaproteobacteria bacterium]|nr:CBS domain-containing protein [Gammaproteobacteria bacterium]
MYVSGVLEAKGTATVVSGENVDVATAVKIMCDNRVGAILITGPQGNVVGVLTERDILRRFAEFGNALGPMPVSKIMSRKVLTTTPDTTVEQVLEIMTRQRFRHMPVLAAGKLIGVVSMGDLVKALLEEKIQEAESLKQYITS